MGSFLSRTALLLIVCALVTQPALGAAGGTVEGVVLDDQKQPLPGATVKLGQTGSESAPRLATTDLDGSFSFTLLGPGTYTLEASLDGFQTSSTQVRLVADQRLRLQFQMAPARYAADIVVTADTPEALATSEVALLERRREAEMVSDAIGREEISKTADLNAARVVERVTGVSVVDGKYVFVRGLGERYSSTTLNGSAIPTTEPEKRVVPLDLFPAKLIDNVTVLKSYTPDRPGDFAAGMVEIETMAFPATQSLNVTAGLGYHDGTSQKPFETYGGGLSFTGSGGQPMPGSIGPDRVVRGSVVNPNGYSPAELEVIGESFSRIWEPDTREAPYNGGYSASYGNTFGSVGLQVAATATQGYERQSEIERYYDIGANDQLEIQNDYVIDSYNENARNGLLANLSLRMSDNNQVFLRTLYSRDSNAESRFFEGFNGDAGNNFRNYRLRYQIEEIASAQMSGNHFFEAGSLANTVEWRLAYSEATRHEDLRETLYEERSPGVYTMRDVSQSGSSMYIDLEDRVLDPKLTWSGFWTSGDTSFGVLRVGTSFTRRERDFGSRRFRFVPRSSQGLDLTLPPEQLFTSDNISPTGFEIREETLNTDTYDATHDVAAAFVMLDMTLGRWRLVGGARWEDSQQEVNTFDPFTPDQVTVMRSVNDDTTILPALGVTYAISPRANLRFALSRTVNRPEFRELAPFEFTDVVGGRAVVGNPELRTATIDGIDLRWEAFPDSGQVLAASVFHKRINSPIERTIQPTAQLRTSFANVEAAELTGIEIEARRSLAFLSPALENWAVLANYTYVDSSVDIGEVYLSVLTSTSRAMAGQSDHVGNLAVQFVQPSWGTMARVMLNHTGERISDVGALGLPDLYEAAYQTVDVVVTQDLSFLIEGLDLKLTSKNLLDEERLYTQGGLVQRQYRPGRAFAFSFGYSPL